MNANEYTKELLEARDFLLLNREDYQRARDGFRWPRPAHFNFALDWIDLIGRDNDREALRILHQDGARASRTYSELSAHSNRLANFLRELGVSRGDAVLLMLDNTVELWESFLALAKLGAVVIPTAPLLSASDLKDRMTRGALGGVRYVIAASHYTDRFDRPEGWTGIATGPGIPGWRSLAESRGANATFVPDGTTAADDPLLLYFTSGTTKNPKLVLHSHVSYPIGHLSTMYWIGLQPGDVHLNISSPGWAKHAWSCIFAPWLAESTVLSLNHTRFDAVRTLDALVSERVTTFCAPPTVWRLLIQQDLRQWKTSLRELISAGEPLNPEVIDRVRDSWGLTIRDGFGQTETTAIIGNSPGQPLTPGAMGKPLPGYRVTLLDVSDEEAEEGEVSVELAQERPVGLMQGYRNEMLQPIEGTYYRTGDIARRNADGTLTYVGRADDVFKASDYRISPFELESVLIEHPAVLEAAVVPSPDPVRLAVPKAFVTLTAEAQASADTARDILRHARQVLGPFKRIRKIEFCTLPKTISGKIRRVDLRQLEITRTAAGERGETEYSEDDL